MKKVIIVVTMLLMVFSLSGCESYEGYYETSFLDDNLGTIMILDEWEIVLEDDWMEIINSTTKEVVAVQLYRGEYFTIGNTLTDNRVFNPYFDEFGAEEITETLTDGSNLSMVFQSSFSDGETSNEFYSIIFTSGENARYSVQFVFLPTTNSLDQLKTISKSYKR